MKQKRSWTVALVLALVLAHLPWSSGPAQALTYTVTNTSDSGPGSLREAIICANTLPNIDRDGDTIPDPDPITFNIDGDGPHTIEPLTLLPVITVPIAAEGVVFPIPMSPVPSI